MCLNLSIPSFFPIQPRKLFDHVADENAKESTHSSRHPHAPNANVNPKTGKQMHVMQPIMSSADLYRERRRSGQGGGEASEGVHLREESPKEQREHSNQAGSEPEPEENRGSKPFPFRSALFITLVGGACAGVLVDKFHLWPH
jgi:hypothetical protein